MRALLLVLVLLNMPAWGADLQVAQFNPALEQQIQLQQQQLLLQEQQERQQRRNFLQQQEEYNRQQQNQRQKYPNAATQRHPGDYCCRHCPAGELPCGNTCLPKAKFCAAKTTCSCSLTP